MERERVWERASRIAERQLARTVTRLIMAILGTLVAVISVLKDHIIIAMTAIALALVAVVGLGTPDDDELAPEPLTEAWLEEQLWSPPKWRRLQEEDASPP